MILICPPPLRVGLTLETAFDWEGREVDKFKIILAYAHLDYVHNDYRSPSTHVGLEGTFLNLIAVRYGHSTRFPDGINSWGLGLHLEGDYLGPIALDADYGQMSYDNDFLDENEAIWGLRARYNF